MPVYHFHWQPELVDHLAQHGVSIEDFQRIVEGCQPRDWSRSRSTGRPLVYGETSDGRKIACIFDLDKNKYDCVPVTAYEVE